MPTIIPHRWCSTEPVVTFNNQGQNPQVRVAVRVTRREPPFTMVDDTCRALGSSGIVLASGKVVGMTLVPAFVSGCNFMQYPARYLQK